MKTHKTVKVVAVFLSVLMLFSAIPMTAFAAWADENIVYDGSTFGTNDYYNVISKKDYTLVPGAATETEMVINNAAGNRRQVMHVLECDPSNPDISIIPGYYNIDKDITDSANWATAGMTKMAAKYENELGYNVVCGMNTALAYDNNAPYSYLVYNGQVLVDHTAGINDFHSGYCKTLLCVYKDEATGKCSCELRTYSQGLRGDEWQAIGANFTMTVKDGVLVNKTVGRGTGAARSMVGVKEDGTLVLVMNDGRGANNSVGFSDYEEGESMLALGCKWAFNCDGGGSSGFVSKRAGETEVTMRSVPCDGAERPTINGVFIVSNVGPTGELNNVNINSDYDYFAPGTTYTFTSDAIDTHGYAMDVPADATWALSDASFGTISNGTFVSNGTTGDVDVQVLSGGNVVGSKTIHVTNPTTLTLSDDSTVVPYSTPDKIRTITFPIVAQIGEAKVFYDNTSFNVASSNPAAGTIDGFTFTATQDESASGTTVTLTYQPTGQTLTYTIGLGKGSEVIWDFEDQDVHGFKSQADAEQWQAENGHDAFSALYSGGNISTCVSEEVFLASKENGGQVHNGNYAVGLTIDMSQVGFNNWTYANIYNVEGIKVLRDTANGINASTFGMWVYIPEGFQSSTGSLAIRFDFMAGKTAATAKRTNFNGMYKGKTVAALTEADIPENRWIYVTTPLSSYNYVRTQDPVNGKEGYSPGLARMYVKPDKAQTLTYYFDNFTLDYSSAVDDRVPPTVNTCYYATQDTNLPLDDDTVISTPEASFVAEVSDDSSGVDFNTAAVYVDGYKVPTNYSGNTIFCNSVPLSVGTHKVKFEIADELGNYTTQTKTFVCNSTDATAAQKTVITLEGRNDSGEAPMPGSVYYIDVCRSAGAGFESEFTVELNTANEWILDQLIVNKGYDVTYSVKEATPDKVTFKCNTNVASGEKEVMFSIPVKVYNPLLTNGSSDGSPVIVSGLSFAAPLNAKMSACSVDGAYGNYAEFAVSDLEAVRTITRHDHDAELTVQNKAATCTEAGYTGRTYCETCGSVVDWGTVVPAKGHSYAIDGNRFVCSDCGDVYQAGTGLFEMNGKTYYAINNNLVKGWQTIENDVYYFGDDYAAVNGSVEIAGITYEFENNILAHGTWVNDGIGLAYYWAGECLHSRWFEEDGKTYHFDASGHAALGYTPVAQGQIATLYHFDETTGALIETITQNGIFFTNNADGDIYYISGGHLLVAGLVKYGDDFYYFPGKFKALRNSSRYIDEAGAHGYVEPGTYYFGNDCKMLTNKKNGPNEDGYFYINDVLQRAYQLIQWEGSYYFISDAHKYAKNVKIYLSEQYTNGTDLVPGYYTFDSTGKIELKNGPDEDGYFYLNGVRQNAYQLIKYYGHYYFVYDGHKYAKDVKLYLTEKFTAGTELPVGSYYFDSTGKMDQKSGPQSDGFFYLNGVRQNAYQIIKWEDNYYFVYDGHKYAKNVKLYLTEQFTNGTDLTPGYYNFDSEGKLILKNGPDADGFFYLNGVRQNAYKLVEFEGEYYFINDGHKYAKNVTLYLGEQFTNGTGFEPGNFTFDSEGKLNVKNGPQSDGYFYLNGVRQSAYKLVEFEDNYYFISDAHKYAKSANVYLGEQFTSGTPFNPGYYSFDENGVMQIKNGPQADGFFYLNNVRQNAYQLIDYNGYFFFINDGHKYTVNKRIYLSASFVEGKTYPNGVPISPGYYTFDKEGKMVVGVDINGVKNVRDIGGWVTTDGKKIKEKMLIRGAELDGAVDPESMITEIGINTMLNDIKVKTEMDLRSPEVGGSDMLGDTVTHKYYDATMYEDAFTEEGKAKMKEVFTDLANPDNYPIYVHCTHGIDRTGTVCYILEAVLGLSEANATSEYSLSNWFRTYNKKKLDALKAGLNEYSGTTLKAKATAYLIDCGITESQINSIRNTLLIG